MGPRGTIRVCVAITALVHVVTYLLNTQLPLHVVALGGSHAQIGWLFAITTGAAMVLRPRWAGGPIGTGPGRSCCRAPASSSSPCWP